MSWYVVIARGVGRAYAFGMSSTELEVPARSGPETRLESWKEIAAYLGRDVRTVQRWEKSEGLPVHRHLHEKQGSVYAFKAEVDQWRSTRDVSALPEYENGTVALSETAPVVPPEMAPTPVIAKFPLWAIALLIAAVVLAAGSAYFVWRGSRLPVAVTATPQPQDKPAMIAVLPFENLSGDPAQEYFSDGMTEELIVQIGRLHADGLDAISVGSAMAFKNRQAPIAQAAKELGATYVVQGSVRRSGELVRVSAHLVRTRDNAHLWDESYDRDLRDVLGLQKEVAETIAHGISTNLGQQAQHVTPSIDPRAYEAYLKGRYFWNKRTPDDLNKAVAEFQEATRIEPTYAPAYVGLADSYALLGSAEMGERPPREAMPLAQKAATRALKLDPQLAEAHASLAHIKLIYEWDTEGSEKEFQRAIELNPAYATAHQWYALLLNAAGRSEEALKELQRARSLDPLSPAVRSALAEAYYFARRYDKAEAESRSALELDPNFVLGLLNLGRAQEQQGRMNEAIVTFDRARTLTGKGPAMTMFLADAYARKGEQAAAKELLGYLLQLRQGKKVYVPALYIASLNAALGNHDQAFRYMQEALAERCEYLIYLRREPMSDGLRGDPRFARLIQSTAEQTVRQ
jgi:TolB-like protein/tetratricopeptide (TPR) repeat protein